MAEIPSNKIDGVALSSVGPGHRLRDARKLCNLDQSDIATQLNLDLQIINALEKDDYARMPPAVFVRGYLRAYAGMVGLDPDEVLASYDAMQGVDPNSRRSYRAPTRISATGVPPKSNSSAPWVILLLLLAAVAGSAYWWWLQRAPTPVPARTGSTETPGMAISGLGDADPLALGVVDDAPAPTPTSNPATPSAPPEPVADVDVASEAVPDAVPADAVMTPAETSAIADPVPETAPAIAPAATARAQSEATPAGTAASPGIDRLVLRYTDNCWTQIRDATGKRLAFGVMKSGQVLDLEGQAPFQVTLGQADGVSLEFNGKPFDHMGFSRGKIARFEIAADGSAQ